MIIKGRIFSIGTGRKVAFTSAERRMIVEYKFRAWEKLLKEIIPVHNIDFESKIINTNGVWRMFHEVELMQYIGLHDKNGVEIYRSDICQCFCFKDKAFQHEVVYQNGAFGYYIEHQGFISFTENHNFKWKNRKSKFIKVVGNVFELEATK